MLDKTFNPAEVEARHYPEWEKSGSFTPPATGNAAPFAVMMPPPNVTGSLHMGHALNNTLQDVLTRYHRMTGKDSLWMPGTDHAGIATQMVVERQLAAKNVTRHDLGRDKFIERVWEWKAESGSTITGQLRRLGTSPDWSREAFTMSPELNKAVTKVFVQLHKEGLIYRDKRLVNWDPKLHTAISDLEVEPREIKGSLWHFRYPLADDPERFITIATTRPETMLGDTAVAVNPKDERYQDLIGKMVKLPITGRLIPIVGDDYADPETGSGAVKITPAHDFNDFGVGQRHKLAMINILDRDAKITADMPAGYAGLDRFDARKKIVEEMESLGLLEKIEPHTHKVPHGDRSGVVIEPWLTDQWYVDAATLAKPAIEAVETGKTVFVPKSWENTYYDWMRNIQPWCISRQIWWGHQIPAWYGPDGQFFVEESEAEAQAAADAHYGRPTPLTRDADVLDTWFSSALWPFSTLGWPDKTPELDRYYPGDVLVTAFDIIFFWVARMMMMGIHFMGEVPFKTVYIHALVRDEKGQKMSKSKGNVIDPLVLIDKFGADALRFTMAAMVQQGRDIRLSEQRVEGYRNFATKLWNACRYAEMNGAKPVPGFDPAGVQMTLNKWIVTETATLSARVAKALEAYQFGDAAMSIYQFVWGSFCDWYLEFTKPVLAGGSEAEQAETRATTAWVIGTVLHLLNPFMPFMTEELHERLGYGEGRLLDAAWPAFPAGFGDESARAEIDWLVRLISEIRSIRADMNLPGSAQLTVKVKDASAETRARIDRHRELILRLARLAEIAADDTVSPAGSAAALIDEATIIIPLAGLIDLDKERARLSKEIEKLAGEAAKLEAKLGNPAFVERAPEEVLDDHRARRDDAHSARAKLEAVLKLLAA